MEAKQQAINRKFAIGYMGCAAMVFDVWFLFYGWEGKKFSTCFY
jgi:hypothetical protein